MSFRMHEDGECAACGQHTIHFCDSCKRFFCDEHLYEMDIPNSSEKHRLCKECYEKGKEKNNHQFKGYHPHYKI